MILVTANPVALPPYPSTPITTAPPTVFVSSPAQNQTYNSSTVPLQFIVIKPDSWYTNVPGVYCYIIRNITSIYYTVDGGERQNVTVNDAASLTNGLPHTSPLQTLRILLTLDLTAGQHTVEVGVDVESYYLTSQLNDRSPSTTVNGTSKPIDFDVVLPAPPALTPQSVADSSTTISSTTPTVPEVSWLVIWPLFISILGAAFLVRYRKMHC